MYSPDDSFVDHNAQLAQAGLDLMACESEDGVFEIISAFFERLVPDAIVIIAQATPDLDAVVVSNVLGVDDTLLAKAAKMIGFEVKGTRYAVDDALTGHFGQRRLARIPGGLGELAASAIPQAIGDLVGKAFGVGAVYSVGIADERAIFGIVHVLTRRADEPVPGAVIDSFIFQCFLALRSLRAQRALQESREEYRLLAESIKDVVWTLDPDTLRFLYVSPSVERLRGYTVAEVLAEPMDAALTPEGSELVRALLSKRGEEASAAGFSPDEFYVEELEQPCKDGSTVWTEVIANFYVNARSGKPEVRGVTRDITKRRKSEESLRVYAGLLEATPASIIAFDADGTLLYANELTLEMHGYTRDEFMKLNLSELDVPEDAERIGERFKHTAEFGENAFEVVHRRKDGSTFPLDVRNRSAIWDGRTVVLSVGTDSTERKRTEQALLDGTARLEQMVRDVAEAMGRIVEVRDPYTQGHEVRVAKLATLIAQDMGLSDDEIGGVEMAAIVHDIGKLSVPTEILNKPGKLLSIEFELIKQHPVAGYEILKDIAFPWDVSRAVRQHHERLDGSGYPDGLSGDEICLTARILAVADVIEAMASHRPYRAALGVDAAMAEIVARRDTFDPAVVAACERLFAAGMITL